MNKYLADYFGHEILFDADNEEEANDWAIHHFSPDPSKEHLIEVTLFELGD